MWAWPLTERGLGEEDTPEGRARTRESAPAGPEADPGLFRRVMASHAAGVVIVTAYPDGVPVGMTATSFTSVSLHPPLVSFYVNAESRSWPGVRDSAAFAVNILTASQRPLAVRFATRGVDRFAAPTEWRLDTVATPEGEVGRVPLLDGAYAHVLCAHHELLAIGDHWLVVGRVAGAAMREDGEPLLYHRSRYGRFTAEGGAYEKGG